MSRTSPTQRSLKYLRKQGYTVAITEKWNHFARIRQDLFGFIDLVAIKPGEIVGVQTTSYSGLSSRRHKICEAEAAIIWVQSGGKIFLHGWKKKGSRWELVEEDITYLVLVR